MATLTGEKQQLLTRLAETDKTTFDKIVDDNAMRKLADNHLLTCANQVKSQVYDW